MNPFTAIAGSFLSNLPVVGNFFGGIEQRLYQQENRDYMRGMQRESWNREDNAIQRRVADLKAAGLSPTLAAGSAASASSPVALEPRQSNDASMAINDVVGLLSAIQGLQGQQLDNEWKANQVANFTDLALTPARTKSALAEKQTEVAELTRKYADDRGLPPGRMAPVSVEGLEHLLEVFENPDLSFGERLKIVAEGITWMISGSRPKTAKSKTKHPAKYPTEVHK